jgi:hypothetical protein
MWFDHYSLATLLLGSLFHCQQKFGMGVTLKLLLDALLMNETTL